MNTPINDGGPAFPAGADLPNASNMHDGGYAGMSLRDYFAAKAMNGLLSDSNVRRGFSGDHGSWPVDPKDFVREVANCAFRHADAMLAARSEVPKS